MTFPTMDRHAPAMVLAAKPLTSTKMPLASLVVDNDDVVVADDATAAAAAAAAAAVPAAEAVPIAAAAAAVDHILADLVGGDTHWGTPLPPRRFLERRRQRRAQ